MPAAGSIGRLVVGSRSHQSGASRGCPLLSAPVLGVAVLLVAAVDPKTTYPFAAACTMLVVPPGNGNVNGSSNGPLMLSSPIGLGTGLLSNAGVPPGANHALAP